MVTTNRYSIIKISGEPKYDDIYTYQDALKSLWNRNLLNSSSERFSWLFDGNPYGRAISWLAFIDGSSIAVGTGTFFPRKFFINGRDAIAGIAVNFAVEKAHRVFGPALQLQKTMIAQSMDSGFDLIIGFPNKASRGVLTRAGYRVLGEAQNRVKMLKTENKIARFLKIKTIAKLISIFVDSLLFLIDTLLILRNRGYIFRTEIRDVCDNRFDELWERAKEHYFITGEKTSSYLNWRYSGNVLNRNRYFCLFDNNADLLRGYIVYSVRDNVVNICEMCVEDDGRILENLILMFAKFMRKDGVHSISLTYLSGRKFDMTLTRLIFIRRPYNRQCLIYIDDRSPWKHIDEMLDKNLWFLMDGELDI